MTDNEIIKALECCKKDDCDNCPNDFGNCYANLAGYAHDLINRQKAEIERLNEYISRCKSGEEYWVKCLLERPNEAIKEFAKYLIDNYSTGGIIAAVDLVDAAADWGRGNG